MERSFSYQQHPLLPIPVLTALLVLAAGITGLQVSANRVDVESEATSRLNLTQAFNSLGTTTALRKSGGLLIPERCAVGRRTIAPDAAADLHVFPGAARSGVGQMPYAAITFALLLLALLLLWSGCRNRGTAAPGSGTK